MAKGRLAGTLSLHNRPVETYLEDRGFDRATIAKTLPWSNKLEADVRRHMVGKIRADDRRIDKRTAHIMLGQALARLPQNRNGGSE